MTPSITIRNTGNEGGGERGKLRNKAELLSGHIIFCIPLDICMEAFGYTSLEHDIMKRSLNIDSDAIYGWTAIQARSG